MRAERTIFLSSSLFICSKHIDNKEIVLYGYILSAGFSLFQYLLTVKSPSNSTNESYVTVKMSKSVINPRDQQSKPNIDKQEKSKIKLFIKLADSKEDFLHR